MELVVSSVNFKSLGPPRVAENNNKHGRESPIRFQGRSKAIDRSVNTVARIGAAGRRADTGRQHGQEGAEILKLLDVGGEFTLRR